MMIDIAKYLRNRIEAENLNCREIADGAGVGYRTLMNVVNYDISPRVSTLEPILDYFGLELCLRVKKEK